MFDDEIRDSSFISASAPCAAVLRILPHYLLNGQILQVVVVVYMGEAFIVDE